MLVDIRVIDCAKHGAVVSAGPEPGKTGGRG